MKGFQLFFEAFKAQLQNKLDVIVSVVHFMLVDDNFVCVGVGDTFTAEDDKAGKEQLPSGWNSNSNVYSLKYRSQNGNLKVIVKGILVGEHFIVSVVPLNSSETVHSVSIKPDQYITSNWSGGSTEAFVGGDVKPLEDLLRREVFSKLREPVAKVNNDPKQQEQSKEDKSILLEKNYHPRGIGPDAQRNPYNDPYLITPRIGGADLDPLNRGVGGGMLYDPFSPNRNIPSRDPMYPHLPPGAVPPGARFDPFGPPLPSNLFPKGGGKSGGFPPPDHFPPPGGYDPFL